MTIDTKAKRATLLSCCLSCFIAWLDFAIVNTALPAIKTDLSAPLLSLQWVMNAFILAITVFIVTLGRISDHVGRKTMNILGVALFGVSSLLAGLAQSAGWLIFARLLQGIGSAAIIPTSIALISHAFHGEEKGKAIGIWSGITGLGMAIGPALGGFFVSALSWRWIFFINVPISILSVIISALYISESRVASGSLKPDYKGCALLTLGLGSLVFALMHAPDWGWTSSEALSLLIAAIATLVVFYFLENRSRSPTIPFSLFTDRRFFCASLAMFGLVFVFTASLFLIPLYLIQLRGQEPYEAGLTILPITACIAILSPFVGKWMTKISAKKLMLLGLWLFLISTLLQAFFVQESSLSFILISFICLGLGWSIARTPATTSALASAPAHYAGTASGVLWTVQNAGGALSIAITLTLFRKLESASFLSGYHASMWLLSAITIGVIGAIAFFLKPKTH